MARRIEVRVPLFDRLVDLAPQTSREARPYRTMGRRELRESVRRELERLLNTRTSIGAHRLSQREWTVIDYGIPDFYAFSAGNPRDERRIEEILAEVIAAFEPRLRDVHVKVEQFKGKNLPMRVRIDAALVIDKTAEAVSFPAVIGTEPGGSRVATS